ncbi:tyrosinase family protein [Aspergillus mulundensis]|uniref:Tyrosinase copper-binding domain-containing protein n=1 Tax=Aspergillus mulundensis TaxID=1810919 RepID=A0A3D8R9Z2_9EURO|nr:Uncharacterized protein DSM5745_08380 [Aspergillus mulundensis]RDW70869.1 Uncharacterized protein DSM5745_08380 [Aspergillus mulundensis]
MYLRSSFAALAAVITISAAAAGPAPLCNAETASVRKEWSALTPDEQLGYIDAVWCLRGLPSHISNTEYPGVRDRYDDFVATHINLSMTIHRSASFLAWHRHYLFLFETALKDECGYNGTIPYWDWTQNSNLYSNPIFDTSQPPEKGLSLSGDGAYNASAQVTLIDQGVVFPAGRGGGCILDGPLKDWTVHMGPTSVIPALMNPYEPIPPEFFAYNPRCLERNIRPSVVQWFNNASVIDRLLSVPSIEEFQDMLDRAGRPPTWMIGAGIHPGGHTGLGGEMADFFTSPQDPVFYLHHGMVDRVWDLWQCRGEQGERLRALNGTLVFLNPPEAEEATLDTVIEFGVLGGSRRIGELMDARGGEYCYRYE